jgi:hypothetical protein
VKVRRVIQLSVAFTTIGAAAAYPQPRRALDVPALVAESDVVVLGKWQISDTTIPSGRRSQINLSVSEVFKGDFAGHVLDLGHIDVPVQAPKPPVLMMYGVFFLRKNGVAFDYVDPLRSRLPAPPPQFRIFPTQSNPLSNIAAQLAAVLTIPPNLIIDPALGLGAGPMTVFVSKGKDKSGRNIMAKQDATKLRRAEAAYNLALDGLDSISLPIKRPFLVSVFNGTGASVGRMQALAALMQAGDSSLLESALAYLMQPDDDAVGTNSALMLGLMKLSKDDSLAPIFVKLLESHNENIREGAVLGVINSQAASALPALVRALRDPDYQVRESAVSGICNRSRACAGQKTEYLAEPENIPKVLQIVQKYLGAPG